MKRKRVNSDKKGFDYPVKVIGEQGKFCPNCGEWVSQDKRGQLIPQAQKRFVELYETFYLGEDDIAEEDDDG